MMTQHTFLFNEANIAVRCYYWAMAFTQENERNQDTFWNEAPWWGEYLAQYREALKYVKGARVLDVGCGFGFGSRYLFDNGAIEVTGIDINKQQLQYAQKKFGRDGVEFKEIRAEKISLPPHSFDLVTCFQVLERSTNPDEILANISKALDKKGHAMVSTVNRFRFENRSDSPAEKTHMAEFDLKELKAMFKKHFARFEILGLHCTRDDSMIFKNPLTEKIPHKVRDTVARKIFGQSFFPSENEFVLKPNDLDEAPLFYVVCQKS